VRLEKQIQRAFVVTSILAFPIMPVVLLVFIGGSAIAGLHPLTIFMEWAASKG